MAGTLIEDYTGDGRSSSTEELPSDQQSHSGESLAEWRSSEQVENGTPSTSPAYSDSDDDDCGPRPSELYGKFTWRIDNFSQINKRELRSNSFDVGGYKCFNAFWLGMDPSVQKYMTREKTDTVLKVLEVTSTLVMDSLYSGLKALEYQTKNKKGVPKLAETVQMDIRSTPMVLVDQDMFVLADDVILLLERAALDTLPHQPLPTKDDKSSQNRTKDGSSGDDFNKDSIERDDKRLVELGWKTLEFFALAHIFSRIEVAYQEAVALKRQEELIREEEAAGLAEIELKAKRSAAEKEKRIRKKQAKQKKNSRKNNKGKNEKVDIKEIVIESSSPPDDRILDDLSSQAEEITSNADNPEEVSDISDNRDDSSELLHNDLEDSESSPVNWETDASETQATVPEGGEMQNEHAGKRTYFLDDSSSTCSSDSVPSVILNTGGAWTNVKSSSNRGNNRRNNKDHDARSGLGHGGLNSVPNGIAGSSSSTSVNSKDHQHEDDRVVSQKKQNAHRQTDVMSPSKLRMTESSVSPIKKQHIFSQQPKSSLESANNLSSRASEASGAVTASSVMGVTTTPTAQLVSNKGPLTIHATHNERSVPVARHPQVPTVSKSEAQKQTSLVSSGTATQAITVSRPLSAPQVPAAKQTAPVASAVQTVPLLSRSMSAVGRLGNEPSASAPSYIPRSYRNAMMERSSVGASSFTHQTSSEQRVAQSQSMFSLSPSILSPEHLAGNDRSSLRQGLTFGTVKPETLNQWREESSQQASSSSSSSSNDHGAVSSSNGGEFEKFYLFGKPRSKQLSEISARSTPFQPQGLVSDEFPHLDIINDLLNDEQCERRTLKVLQRSQQAFARQYSMPNNSSTPDYGMFAQSDPYLFDQPEQYYDEEIPRFYNSLNGTSRGLRERSYSHFDLPSYSNGQFDDMMMNQWPYGQTDLSLPNFGADMNGYPYQSSDYPNSANGLSRYPPYRPANGH
uniref:MATH domain-containing protein n=1 Tax=Oryza nivara TaxID=4536 RepID=A0A0E0JBZ3_ORYNI